MGLKNPLDGSENDAVDALDGLLAASVRPADGCRRSSGSVSLQ